MTDKPLNLWQSIFIVVVLCMPHLSLAEPKTLATKANTNPDPYLWLEEIRSPQAIKWVETHNKSTLDHLQADKRYAPLLKNMRSILMADDRLHLPSRRGNYVYHFLQDTAHTRGILRRTTIADYLQKQPQWQTVLDIDALASQEKENWVYSGMDCLEPQAQRCLIVLSRGGRDATVTREFDTETKQFIHDGFQLPEAKGGASWYNQDALMVATDFGPKSLTLSGYPRIVKLWKRGTPLSAATVLFEGKEADVSIYGFNIVRPEGTYNFVGRGLSFFENENFLIQSDLSLKKLPFPLKSEIRGVFQQRILVSLQEDWNTSSGLFKSGSLIALPIDALDKKNFSADIQVLFTPGARSSLAGVDDTKDYILLDIMENVKNRLERMHISEGKFVSESVPLNKDGTLSVISTSNDDNNFFVKYESFLTPSTLYWMEQNEQGPEHPLTAHIAKQLPSRFDSKNFMVEQLHATSKDGTQVPYFVVRRKDAPFNGSTPTLMYGYGGFEDSQQPFYMETAGKVWLEKGGAYVLTNIRGGGEFGPAWHAAGLKENRQRVFDDFIAIAESLIQTKLTSPRHLGIQGGSNGGLLMGVMLTQRPDLFRAIVCQVPLLDMLRYHKLLAGNSWMGEYGNPDIPAEAEYLAKYSPYHNFDPKKKYPKVFFMTSTEDDRVHPGHARKMAACMEGAKAPFFYYENIEGGHGGNANLEQAAMSRSLMYVYLYQQLMD